MVGTVWNRSMVHVKSSKAELSNICSAWVDFESQYQWPARIIHWKGATKDLSMHPCYFSQMEFLPEFLQRKDPDIFSSSRRTGYLFILKFHFKYWGESFTSHAGPVTTKHQPFPSFFLFSICCYSFQFGRWQHYLLSCFTFAASCVAYRTFPSLPCFYGNLMPFIKYSWYKHKIYLSSPIWVLGRIYWRSTSHQEQVSVILLTNTCTHFLIGEYTQARV